MNEQVCGTCDFLVNEHCTNGESDFCGWTCMKGASCASWFSFAKMGREAAAAAFRNAQIELTEIREKIASLSIVTGAIGHIDNAIKCLNDAADALYHEEKCGEVIKEEAEKDA